MVGKSRPDMGNPKLARGGQKVRRGEQPSTPEDVRDQEQVVPLEEGLKTPDHMARRLSPKKGGKKHGPVA